MPKHYAVGAARASRREPGRLYDGYGVALYGYCWTLLADEEAAATSLACALGVASVPEERPDLPDRRLSTLLFRLARDECLRRGPSARGCYAGRRWSAPLPALMVNALGELTPGERDVLELSVRHRFHGDQLAVVLDVPPASADELAVWARRRFAQAFGTVVLASSGSLAVPHELADDPPPLPVLLGMLVPPPPPAGLRSAVTALAGDPTRRPPPVVHPGRAAVPRPRRPDPAEVPPRAPGRSTSLPPGVRPVTPARPELSEGRVAWARSRHPVTEAGTAEPVAGTTRHAALRWTGRLAAIAVLTAGVVLASGGPLW